MLGGAPSGQKNDNGKEGRSRVKDDRRPTKTEKTRWTFVTHPTVKEPIESFQRGGGAMEKVTKKGHWTKLSLCPSPLEQANQISTGDAAGGQAAVLMKSNTTS